MKKMIWLGCVTYMLIGLAHVVIGSILEELIRYYHVEYTDGGQLIFNQFAGFLLGVLMVPFISRSIGRRNTLLLGLICLMVGETVYSFLPPWGWMLAAGPAAGFGFGAIEAVIGAMIIEFVEDKKAVAMSRLEVFFGLGALLMPALASLLIVWDAWKLVFPLITLITVVTGSLWRFTSFGHVDKLLSKKTVGEVAAVPPRYTLQLFLLLSILSLFMLLYVGIEMSIVNFLPSILIKNVGVSHATATLSITIFWSAMVVGRMFAGSIAEYVGYRRYLLISCSGTLFVFTMFALVTQLWVSFAMIILLGLTMAGIFAIALIFANRSIPGTTERTTSIMVAFGGIGGAFLPKGFGAVLDAYSTSVTEWLLVGFTLFMLLLMLVATKLPVKQSP